MREIDVRKENEMMFDARGKMKKVLPINYVGLSSGASANNASPNNAPIINTPAMYTFAAEMNVTLEDPKPIVVGPNGLTMDSYGIFETQVKAELMDYSVF